VQLEVSGGNLVASEDQVYLSSPEVHLVSSGAWKANPRVIFPSLRFCLTLMSFESYFHEGTGSSHEGILCGLGLGFRV